jgi:lipopolysaccharide heptosyltransferase I
MNMNGPRILVIKLSSLGDVLHSLPTLTAIRRAHPRAYIAWVVGPKAAEIVTRHPGVDRVYGLGVVGEQTANFHPLPSTRDAMPVLRAERFDISLDMQGLFRTAVLAFRIGARQRVGFRGFQEGAFLLCNRRVSPCREDIHAIHGYLQFARYLGADDSIVDFGLVEEPDDKAWAENLLGVAAPIQSGRTLKGAATPPIAAIAPAASRTEKRWSADGFAQTAAALRSAGARVVVVGSSADAPIAARICSASGAEDLTGQTTLPQLAALLRRCQLFIGNDSGPLHLAAAVGTPCLSLFGPTLPLRTGPFGNHVVLVGHGISWAEKIAPDQVIKTAEAILAGSRSIPTQAQ